MGEPIKSSLEVVDETWGKVATFESWCQANGYDAETRQYRDRPDRAGEMRERPWVEGLT